MSGSHPINQFIFNLLLKTQWLWDRKPNTPRVLLGVNECAGIMRSLRHGLHQIGVPATFINFRPHPFQYGGYDSFWQVNAMRWCKRKRGQSTGKTALFYEKLRLYLHWLIFWQLVLRHDVFLYGGYDTFFPYRDDLPILKALNKKLIFLAFGSDARPPYLNGKATRQKDPLPKTLKATHYLRNMLRELDKYADAVIDTPMTGHFRPSPFINQMRLGSICAPLEAEALASASVKKVIEALAAASVQTVREALTTPQPETKPLRILHCPSDPATKGTDRIRAAVENLKRQGLPLTLITLTHQPNHVIAEELGKCDLLIDQLYSDLLMPILTTEAAWFAKPSLLCGYARPQWKQYVPASEMPPSCYVPPEDFEQTLEHLVRNPHLLLKFGLKARQYVETHAAPDTVARKILRVIQGDIPESWWFDPQDIRYVHGYGQTADLARLFLHNYIEENHPKALLLDDKPKVKQALLDFIKPLNVPTFSILIATSGRPTLRRTLESIRSQTLIPGDEVILIGDGPLPEVEALFREFNLPGFYMEIPGPFDDSGHTPRNMALPKATGDYILYMDDDDAYYPGGFDNIRPVIRQFPGKAFLFQVLHENGIPFWRDPVLELGRVCGLMFVHPNIPGKYAKWPCRRGGDFVFIRDTMALMKEPPLWRKEMMAVIRPYELTLPPLNQQEVGKEALQRLNLATLRYPIVELATDFRILELRPQDLIFHPRRFDLIGKLIYARFRDMGQEKGWPTELYNDLTDVMKSYGVESVYSVVRNESLREGFHAILDSIKAHGFNPQQSLIPIGKYNDLLDGSHRLAACYLYGKTIHAMPFNYTLKYNARKMRERGLAEKWIDLVTLEWCTLNPNAHIALITPKGAKEKAAVKFHTHQLGELYQDKQIHLTPQAATHLWNQLQELTPDLPDWQETQQNASEFTAFVFDSHRIEDFQQQVRSLYNTPDDCILVTTTREQTLRLAQALFNANSLAFLNQTTEASTREIPDALRQLRNTLAPSADIFLTEDIANRLLNGHPIEAPEVITSPEAPFSPAQYFYYYGLKIMAPRHLREKAPDDSKAAATRP